MKTLALQVWGTECRLPKATEKPHKCDSPHVIYYRNGGRWGFPRTNWLAANLLSKFWNYRGASQWEQYRVIEEDSWCQPWISTCIYIQTYGQKPRNMHINSDTYTHICAYAYLHICVCVHVLEKRKRTIMKTTINAFEEIELRSEPECLCLKSC